MISPSPVACRLSPVACRLFILGSIVLSACRTSKPVRPTPVPNAAIGQCADPGRSGVIGNSPDLKRADRDLDGDRRPELVVADGDLCTEHGNCYWNIYKQDEAAGCQRFVGTIAAAVIDRLVRRGEDGFHDLRAWWHLTSDSRVLLEEYRYRHGGYRVTEAMVCRQGEDDRLECAMDAERAAAEP